MKTLPEKTAEQLTPMQIAVYAVNCPNTDECINEIAGLIEKDRREIERLKEENDLIGDRLTESQELTDFYKNRSEELAEVMQERIADIVKEKNASLQQYYERIQELESEIERLKDQIQNQGALFISKTKDVVQKQHRIWELEEALRELISLDERTNVAGEIMSDSQGTIDCFPSPTEWRIAFDKAYKSLTKESAPSKDKT